MPFPPYDAYGIMSLTKHNNGWRNMSDDQNVQDQNLVDDQIEQAISESAAAVTNAAAELNGSVAEPAATGTGITPPSNPMAAAVPNPITSPPLSEDDADAALDAANVLKAATENDDIDPAAGTSILSDVQAAAAAVENANTGGDDELADVKKQALEQLAPLVTKLDLPPQEKFDTLMSIIRAGDDKSLIKPAFDAAQAITDEDKKAQALLDVVNEVNYLTHGPEEAPEKPEEPLDPLPTISKI